MTQNIEKSLSKDLFIQSPFWNARLENLSHPTAIRMAQDLDFGGPMGIGDGTKAFWKGFKHSFGEKDSNIDFLLRVRQKHPQKIALIQIGEFYETWGIDSVFLVEHCGINRMGRKGPRAGMPISHIQSVLNDLTQAGFSVVVCEQADDAHKNGRKIRFISEIITPSSPTYTYGLAMNQKANVSFPEAPPEFGISINSKGITVVEINPDLRTTLILEALTPEAAIIRLNKYSGRMNRVFLHEKVPKSILDAANLKFQNLVRIAGYSSRDFPKRVEELIKIDLDLDADIDFLKTKPIHVENSPHPLYQGTAEQIGILPKRGIPDLIELMLPKGSPATCKNIIKNLLLNPPAQNFATNLRESIIELQTSSKQLPTLIVSNPVKYVKTLLKNEAHPEILKDLFALAEIFLTCQKTLSKEFVNNSLEIVSYISAIKAQKNILCDVSKKIMEVLLPIIPQEEDLAYVPKNELISNHLFENIEDDFRARIARTSNKEIEKLYAKTQKSAQNYEKILNSKLIPIIENNLDKQGKRSKNIVLSYDIRESAMWIKGNLNADLIKKHKLIHPIDRHGKEVLNRWSVKEVEDALSQYKESSKLTCDAIKEVLREVSKELSAYCLPIIHLATFSNLVKTLYLHIKECQPKNWTTNFSNDQGDSNQISLKEFFPYWMRSGQRVTNSLTFDGTCLLTGHNMSGKSTLIRSLATVTILGSIGFMFPAKKLNLSQEIDGWFVRTGASDDPEAGLSSFGVEMTDIKVALRDASSKSFLLIDELGKGTESQAGHAIAGSVLEHLVKRNIRSIFATHWHELFVNPVVDLENVKMIKMHCEGSNPTYKIAQGVDLNSSAFHTAAKIGVDDEIVQRAQQIAQGYDQFAISRFKNYCANDSIISSSNKEGSNNFIKETLGEYIQKDEQVKNLKENQIPSLNDAGYSVVYVLKTSNNFFYVGETDNFSYRVKTHRFKFSNNKCEFFYISVKKGKSEARKIEQQLIIKLKNNGFSMLSISDATNLNFGVLN